jgi:AraC-like DNA-binding protein
VPATATIASAIARTVLHVAERAGVKRQRLLAAAGLPADWPEQAAPRISLRAHRALIRQAVRLTGNPALGLEIGRNAHIGSSSLVGLEAMHARTLEGAVDAFARHFHLLSDGIRVATSPGPGGRLRVNLVAPPQPIAPQARDWELGAAGLLTTLRWITGRELEPLEAWFCYPQPAYVAAYRPIFRCPLRFHMPVTALVFSRRQLALPTLAPDPQMRGVFEKLLEGAAPAATAAPDLVRRAEQQLAQLLGPEVPRLPQVARALHLSVRTLQRELRRAGTSYSALLDAALCDSALGQLRTPRLSIEEIAFAHGYASSSAFVRAVRRWTGLTPLAYRRRAG